MEGNKGNWQRKAPDREQMMSQIIFLFPDIPTLVSLLCLLHCHCLPMATEEMCHKCVDEGGSQKSAHPWGFPALGMPGLPFLSLGEPEPL